jgi:SAM-dependent methyltransferase
MDKKYWNQVAEDHDSEIFDVLAHDNKNLITSRIETLSSVSHSASDLGCGIGKFLPVLSQSFDHVYAYDISERCIEQARENAGELANIEFIRTDLARPLTKMPAVDFILCVNSLIMPSMSHRTRYLRLMRDHLKQNGHLILVVPSLESALYSRMRLIEWNVRRGFNNGTAVRAGTNGSGNPKAVRIQQGIVNLDHIPTKHYLEVELCATLGELGFELYEIVKIDYDWKIEFTNPPRWMKAPYPWDWLVTARKC